MNKANEDISSSERPVGAVYLTGSSIRDGRVDLAKTAKYLSGLEKALKYHINQVNPELSKRSYSVEIRLSPGSLVTDVLNVVLIGGVGTVVTVAAGAYAKTAAEQLAKNDISQATSKDIAKGAMKAMTKTMQIAKHRGSMMLGRSFKHEETKVIDAGKIILINSGGEELEVTKAELEAYRETPKNEFQDMMSLIDKDTSMYVGDEPISKDHIPESAVSVSYDEKRVFDDREERVDDTLIFPELVQDGIVTLEGELTRGNGRSNTLGFSYCGRILKCVPSGSNSIKSMRDMLFGYVRIEAQVDRRSTAKGSQAVLKKPILRIRHIEKIEDDQDEESEQTTLLTDLPGLVN